MMERVTPEQIQQAAEKLAGRLALMEEAICTHAHVLERLVRIVDPDGFKCAQEVVKRQDKESGQA